MANCQAVLRTLICLTLAPLAAEASGVVRARAESEHFARTAETVIGLSSDGVMPNEKQWRAEAERKLQAQVDHLETALPRLRGGFVAARGLVPLSDPRGVQRRLELSGQGWAWLELSFREEPTPQDLEAFRRALAQELQIRPLDRRPRPVRIALLSLAALALAGGLVAAVLRWRRGRVRP